MQIPRLYNVYKETGVIENFQQVGKACADEQGYNRNALKSRIVELGVHTTCQHVGLDDP
jgi:hypothetical protein